jgi:predicted nucleic acid-binding protein
LAIERLRTFLRRHRKLALDTSVFIYQLETNQKYVAHTDLIFSWMERPDSATITSTLTMTELLVLPYREGDEQWAKDYYGLLSTYPNLEWIAPNLEVADLAAQIRALHRLQTPDALQAATAIYAKATGLITNDPIFERVGGGETLVLDKLLQG